MLWRSLTNPSVRTRRLATSTFFMATFAAAILTVSVSASTILPCPANSRSGATRGTLAESPSLPEAEQETDKLGQKVVLTKKGGWIEIQQPLVRPRRTTTARIDKTNEEEPQ